MTEEDGGNVPLPSDKLAEKVDRAARKLRLVMPRTTTGADLGTLREGLVAAELLAYLGWAEAKARDIAGVAWLNEGAYAVELAAESPAARALEPGTGGALSFDERFQRLLLPCASAVASGREAGTPAAVSYGVRSPLQRLLLSPTLVLADLRALCFAMERELGVHPALLHGIPLAGGPYLLLFVATLGSSLPSHIVPPDEAPCLALAFTLAGAEAAAPRCVVLWPEDATATSDPGPPVAKTQWSHGFTAQTQLAWRGAALVDPAFVGPLDRLPVTHYAERYYELV